MGKLDGKVVTFYSYKGGVGRSFLLSNTATLLAQWGYRVLCIDWDLEAPGLHYYFRPHMESPETGLVEMVLGARDGQQVDALGHITPVTFPDGSRLDLIAAGGVGGDYIPNVQGIDWDALYEERDFGNVLEDWRRRWIESYDVIFVDSRTGISDSGGICTAQLPHILAYAFTANQQNVDGVLEVVGRAAKARNGLPYDRSRLLTLPLLCRFDMSEEYERAADWRRKLQPALRSSYNAWVPEGAAVERVLDHCTVPYSAYWSFGEELPVLTEDFRNPQLISYSIASIAGLIARHLEDVRLFTESRDAYVDAAIRTGRRGGQYQYDFFISTASNTDDDARKLAELLAVEGFTSYVYDPRDDPHPVIDTCRHFVLLARDTVNTHQRVDVNYFLRQTLDEQTDRALFPVITPRHILRDLPSIAQSIRPYALSEDALPSVARAIGARVRGDAPPSAAPENSYASPDENLCISHAGPDRAWAEWVAWQLQDAGYAVELDVWHWGAGDKFVERVDQSVRRGRTIALFSEAYFHPDRYRMAEVSEVLAAWGKLIPVRIDHAVAPSALRALVAPNVNYFLRQTLDEQTDRALFPVITPRHILRDLPSIAQSIRPYALSEDALPSVARAIGARVRGDAPPSAAPENSYASPDENLCISHAGPDRAWAEWVAWQLQDAGYAVELDVWHWGAGDKFVERVDQSVRRGRTIALFSEAYFHPDRYRMAEVSEVLAAWGKLIPVRIDHAVAPSALRALVAPSLVGLDEGEARAVLLRAVAGPLGTPGGESRRSGASGPRLPGSLPQVWNVQPRRSNFVGREDLLMQVRTRLTESRTAPVLALSGRIGVGKTQLAIEYAHRFSGEYELVWWVEADRQIPPQLAALARLIDCAAPKASEQEAVQALLNHLRTRPRWLIVFDNAVDPADLTRHLPTGEGHVLITSRNPLWHQVATSVEVGVLDRTEAVDLLRLRSPQLSDEDASRLATALDDLPLALAQAGESLYLFTPDQYLQQLELHADAAVSDGTPFDYPGSLSTQLDGTMTRLAVSEPLAAELLRACSLLAPEPFPLHASDPHRARTPDDGGGAELVRALSHPRAFRQALTAVERLGLARGSGGSIQVDRLTQAVLRDQLTPESRAPAARHASALLATAYPGQAADPETWPHWPALLPHLLAIGPADLTTPLARFAACEACWYLLDRGDTRTALARLQDLHRDWEQRWGADAEDTMWAAAYLARAYADTGELSEAHRLESSTLHRQQTQLGPDHPGTLRAGGNFSLRLAALGNTTDARAVAVQTLEAQRRLLGEDHPDTLVTAGNLAVLLSELGQFEGALTLTEDTLARQRHVLGENHPHTLVTAGNLALHLAARGETERAEDLVLDTLTRQLGLLGETHPDILHTMDIVNSRTHSARSVQQPNLA
ncbi:FxSxx-COOH system tetratricopeptide repeat protein [Streptomyces sp. NBC_00490]|uniref:FxSxx-COOH system tetratricopeptide repeat protein n=1 Tax=Streptomyces sp. NBC_00490 TaxID=2903657 RepID=UPI002E1950A9